jgi:hypothetical protein
MSDGLRDTMDTPHPGNRIAELERELAAAKSKQLTMDDVHEAFRENARKYGELCEKLYETEQQLASVRQERAALITTLENLLDDMPWIGVSRNTYIDGKHRTVRQRSYINALVELRKHRPWANPSRCALCQNTGSLLVEGWRGPIGRVACPNCGGGKKGE